MGSEAQRVPEEPFLMAAQTLAQMVTDEALSKGVVYPEVERMREVSVEIAVAVAKEVFRRGLTRKEEVEDVKAMVLSVQYDHDNYPPVIASEDDDKVEL